MILHLNDIVRVLWVPDGYSVNAGHMVGRVGYVEDLNPDRTRALVQRLTLEGRLASGMAWIPVMCVEPVVDPAWTAALVECRRYSAQVTREYEECQRRWQRQVQEVAGKYKLTVEQ